MKERNVLVIGMVWPEPSSSAAGTRIIQIINLFLSSGYKVTFASAASKSEFSFDFETLAIEEHEITLNDSSFNLLLSDINPDIVLFDRFVTEEQYGWRVHQECPHALKILDTEDLHCLRYARQQALKMSNSLKPVNLFNDLAKREIASILRSDLSLMISEVEMDILHQQFRIDPSLLFYLPFLEEEISTDRIQQWRTFEEREGFVFIGNYLHQPNWNTLQILKAKIWPILRKRIPGSTLHIYGAYASQKVMQMHNEKKNFYVHGRAENARDAVSRHRVLIAPVAFGAGVKGKFIDAMQTGTPSVTTSIGAEAMMGDLEWNGAIEDDFKLFVDQAAKLYQDKEWWTQSQHHGVQIINKRYEKSLFTPSLIEKLNNLQLHLTAHRQDNFFGQILHHHTANSSKYMSLWIEEKNRTTVDS